MKTPPSVARRKRAATRLERRMGEPPGAKHSQDDSAAQRDDRVEVEDDADVGAEVSEEPWSPEQWLDLALARDDERERRVEMLHRRPGAFVIEGEWGWSFEGRRASVRGLFSFARRNLARGGVPSVYRRVPNWLHLLRALREWRSRPEYPLLVLGTHGSPGCIYLDGNELSLDAPSEVTLDELAEMIGPGCGPDRHVHFGGCEVLADEQALERFRKATGVGSVTGHNEMITWATACVETFRVLAKLSDGTLSC